MYRLFDFFHIDEYPDEADGELPWHYPYGLLEKLWLVVWALIGLTGLIYRDQIAHSNELLMVSIGMLALVLVVPQITIRLGRHAVQLGRLGLSIVSSWETYERSAQFIAAFRSTSYEPQMILADRLLFGGNPTEWAQHLINPVLTEYLQLIYLSYFPMLLLVALTLFAARQNRELFRYLVAMNLAMLSCHIFYVLVPVRSPFIIAHMDQYKSLLTYSTPLQGLWFTHALRKDLLDATTMRFDCFPSGHTMHSILAMYFGWKTNSVTRTVLIVVGVSIIFSTIYLRYHYAVDLVAGAGFALLWIWASEKLTARAYGHEPVPRHQLGQKIFSVLQQWSQDRLK